jgi:hypothetical protein
MISRNWSTSVRSLTAVKRPETVGKDPSGLQQEQQLGVQRADRGHGLLVGARQEGGKVRKRRGRELTNAKHLLDRQRHAAVVKSQGEKPCCLRRLGRTKERAEVDHRDSGATDPRDPKDEGGRAWKRCRGQGPHHLDEWLDW